MATVLLLMVDTRQTRPATSVLWASALYAVLQSVNNTALLNSTLSDNFGEIGGGLGNEGGTAILTNTTIARNTTEFNLGGGLVNGGGKLQSSPNTTTRFNKLNAVAMVPATKQAWAVGVATNSFSP